MIEYIKSKFKSNKEDEYKNWCELEDKDLERKLVEGGTKKKEAEKVKHWDFYGLWIFLFFISYLALMWLLLYLLSL